MGVIGLECRRVLCFLFFASVLVFPGQAHSQSVDSNSFRLPGLSLSPNPFEDAAPIPIASPLWSATRLPQALPPWSYDLSPVPSKRQNLRELCTPDDPHARACRYHWRAAFEESAAFLGIEIAGYLKIDKGTWGVVKSDFENGEFWSNYVKTLENFRYNHWNDDDTWRTTWVGHPMSGSFVEFIWVQNAPKAAGLKYGKSWAYWKSRFLAMIPSAIYSAQWLLGPVSESSFGNEGLYYYINHAGKYSNGTGYCDLVVTPFGGLLWSVAEDWADLHFASRIRAHTRNRGLLFASSFITPTKSGANILRLKAPWYRDPDYSTTTPPDITPTTGGTGHRASQN
jgi:hypothetical protein